MDPFGIYVWLAVNALICWGLLLKSYDRKRRDFVPFPLFCGFLPAFILLAAGVQVVFR